MKIRARHKLIPAIAMLLIAVVCLSSASYAWFTMSKTVTASGIQLTVIAPINLLISNAVNGTYAETTTLTSNFGTGKLIPASTTSALDFYHADQIKTTDLGAPSATTTFTQSNTPVAMNTDGYYVDFKLWLKTTGEDDVNVTVSQLLSTITTAMTTYVIDSTITDTTSLQSKTQGSVFTFAPGVGTDYAGGVQGVATAVPTVASATYDANTRYYKLGVSVTDATRFAILDGAGTAVITTPTAAPNVIYGEDVDYFAGITGPISAANAAAPATGYIGTSVTANSTNALFTCTGGTAGIDNTPTAITVRVWFEGQDAECISDVANTSFAMTIGFKDVNFDTTNP